MGRELSADAGLLKLLQQLRLAGMGHLHQQHRDGQHDEHTQGNDPELSEQPLAAQAMRDPGKARG